METGMNDRQHVQDCPSCGKALSARGFFCASCAVQVRCKQCNELLEKNAQACVMCGAAVGAGTATPLANGSASPMNTLELQEDTRSRSLRISFTDSAIGSIGETVNRLVSDKVAPHGPRPFRAAGSTVVMASLPPASDGNLVRPTCDGTLGDREAWRARGFRTPPTRMTSLESPSRFTSRILRSPARSFRVATNSRKRSRRARHSPSRTSRRCSSSNPH
jgi:hypothetical protein